MITLDKDKLKDLYIVKKMSQLQIANELHCSVDIVCRFIKQYNLRKQKITPTKEELTELYINQKLTQREIGQQYGLDHKTIYNYIKKYGIDPNNIRHRNSKKISKSPKKIDNISYKQIYDLYITKNLSRNAVAIELKLSVNLVDDILHKYNITKTKEQIAECKKQTNISHFGEECYTRTEDYKKNIKKAYITQYTSKGVPQHLIETYMDDNLFAQYIKDNCSDKSIEDIASIFNIAYSVIAIRLNKLNLHEYMKFQLPTFKYETELCDWLKELNITFEQHNRTILNGKEIDIYLPDFKMGIEFNGSYWHSEIFKDRLYHQQKSTLAEKNSIFLYHIFEYEWVNKKEEIKHQLMNLLKVNENKIYARKCVIKEVLTDDKTDFLNINHIQGAAPSKYNYGLYYNNQLVSLMTFSISRFGNKYNYELVRFCSLANTNVVGAASKLFKYFVNNKMKSGEVCVSYSDYAKTKGSLYRTLGFKYDHLSCPSYIWWSDNKNYLSRYQTQIKKERETMQSRGYYRIYDCGVKVWEYLK